MLFKAWIGFLAFSIVLLFSLSQNQYEFEGLLPFLLAAILLVILIISLILGLMFRPKKQLEEKQKGRPSRLLIILLGLTILVGGLITFSRDNEIKEQKKQESEKQLQRIKLQEAQENKDKIADWKLYTGEAVLDGKNFLFQFKHPANFVLKSESTPPKRIAVDYSGDSLSVYYSGQVKIVTDWQCGSGEGKFVFAGYVTQKAVCTSPSSPGVTYVSLGGPRAVNWSPEYQTVPVTVVISYKDEQTGKIFDQILSTFKFNDQ